MNISLLVLLILLLGLFLGLLFFTLLVRLLALLVVLISLFVLLFFLLLLCFFILLNFGRIGLGYFLEARDPVFGFKAVLKFVFPLFFDFLVIRFRAIAGVEEILTITEKIAFVLLVRLFIIIAVLIRLLGEDFKSFSRSRLLTFVFNLFLTFFKVVFALLFTIRVIFFVRLKLGIDLHFLRLLNSFSHLVGSTFNLASILLLCLFLGQVLFNRLFTFVLFFLCLHISLLGAFTLLLE